MKNNKALNVQDYGLVIIDTTTNKYYCGCNKFDVQLRKAKIYHSEKYAKDIIDDILSRKMHIDRKLVMLPVEIRIKQ